MPSVVVVVALRCDGGPTSTARFRIVSCERRPASAATVGGQLASASCLQPQLELSCLSNSLVVEDVEGMGLELLPLLERLADMANSLARPEEALSSLREMLAVQGPDGEGGAYRVDMCIKVGRWLPAE